MYTFVTTVSEKHANKTQDQTKKPQNMLKEEVIHCPAREQKQVWLAVEHRLHLALQT